MHGHLEAVAADAVARLETAIGEVASLPLAPLDPESLTRLLVACTGAGDRLTHATARVAVACEERDLAAVDGSRHTAHWWARRTRLTRPDAGRRMHLARRLATESVRPVADAMADGTLRTDQAEAIVRTLDELPDGLEPQTAVEVRSRMLELAAEHDAADLRRLGKRVLELVDPETYEHEEQRRLEAEEERAAATARFTMTHDGQGRVHGRFTLPVLHGELLRNQLLALADPRRGDLTGGGAGEPAVEGTPTASSITPVRLGQALMELVEALPADLLPTHAASSVALTLTMELDRLRESVGVAVTDGGHAVSASEARRLACRAGLVPAVLSGPSQVLDLGRSRRLFSSVQFRALALRDGGCTAHGCGLPSRVCHAHHDEPWSRGGPTDRDNGRLLCPHHHRLAHSPRHRMERQPDGRVSFHRRV